MAHEKSLFARTALAAATLCLGSAAVRAQGVDTVTVVGRGSAGVTGFGGVPLARAPMQASIFGAQQLADAGISSIGGLTRLDASLGDAYNAEGYWSIVSARGYALDNRFNYRRDGLPINAETAIAFDNKERVELLKGTSGMLAGTSAPGGIVNLVVKRPTGPVRSARFEVRQAGSVLGAIDLGDRFGDEGRFGLRLNAAAERLDPQARHTQGERHLLSLAGDWQLGADTLLQAEVESSHQRQPSVAGFSMLGDRVPAAASIDPRINLNDQPWRQPVVLDGTTASLRWQQQLGKDWRFTAHAMQQRLKSDDRTAFPYGVYDPGNYECVPLCDRFAPDGTFTYWEFVSDNERRTSRALSLSLGGRFDTAGIAQEVEFGVLRTTYRGRFQDQIFDIAGTGRIDGSLQTPPSLGATDANTNRDERSTEFFARDAARLSESTQLLVGLRHTRLNRASVRTSPAPDPDGFRPTQYEKAVTAPWLALTQQLAPATTVYASWGQGVESEVAPNRARYSNAGQSLPALKSRQIEVGVKHAGEQWDGSVAVFDIDRPQAVDLGPCDDDDTCVRVIDGSARHRGVEASLTLRTASWLWQGSVMGLDAKRQGSRQDGVNGTRPVNVPKASLRLGSEYRVAQVEGLALQAGVTAESNRVVLPYDDTVRIPGWSRIDLGVRWQQAVGTNTLVWRVGVDNAGDRRAWKESPYQFGHVYLYPLQARTWRASLSGSF